MSEILDFSAVRINDGSVTHVVSLGGGTVTVNYGPPTTASLTVPGAPLTATGSPGGISINFTTFQLAFNSGTGIYTLTSVTTSGSATGTLTLSWSGQTPSTLSSASLVTVAGGNTHTWSTITNGTITVVCFVEGTLIRTPKGDVAVETLQAGDLVVTHSGEQRPVKWIGNRRLNCAGHPDRRLVDPVRIARDAIGPNQPARDLYVSPGHSICLDLCGEVLVTAASLINGATIAQVETEEVSYWHVELDSHDILLANNLPAESYLAMENRGFFDGAGPDAPDAGEGRTHADFCRPFLTDDAVIDFVRRRLKARADTLGWTPSRETDLRLLVEGEAVLPVEDGSAAAFAFPASARDVRLVSNAFVPDLLGGGSDPRRLGVCLMGIELAGSEGARRTIPLDDARLAPGLHPEEGRAGMSWRWTRGELALSPELWTGLTGTIRLSIALDASAVRSWTAPKADVIPIQPQRYAAR